MQATIETWSVGDGEVQCYTEDIEAHRELSRLNPKFAVYLRNGHVFAWQHIVPRCVLAGLGRRGVQNRAVKPKELPPSESRISPGQGDLFGDGPLGGSEEKSTQNEAA
jgi:hypothetical protein